MSEQRTDEKGISEWTNSGGTVSNAAAPVVAEVRRAPRFNRHDVAYNEPFPLWVRADDARALEVEVARLTAEQDMTALVEREMDAGMMRLTQQLESLRTRLRGLEQQWRHDQIDWVDPRTKCAEELAALLTTPEEG